MDQKSLTFLIGIPVFFGLLHVIVLPSFGADIQQRGMNDYTPLHWAVAYNDVPTLELLLSNEADPHAKTRIDDFTTPLQEAEAAGRSEAVQVLTKVTSG